MALSLAGRALPGGFVEIAPYESFLVGDVLASPPMPEGVAHPLFAYLAGHAGMGMTMTDLFALCESSAADGPMQGEVELEFFAELRVERRYEVRASILDVTSKTGRRAGAFDVVTYRLELFDDERIVARSTCSVVFPRRGTP